MPSEHLASDGHTNELSNPLRKQKTSHVLRAMADRELAEGNAKIQLAQILRDAAAVVEQMETEKMEAKDGLPR